MKITCRPHERSPPSLTLGKFSGEYREVDGEDTNDGHEHHVGTIDGDKGFGKDAIWKRGQEGDAFYRGRGGQRGAWRGVSIVVGARSRLVQRASGGCS
jgi:hypothetical protein